MSPSKAPVTFDYRRFFVSYDKMDINGKVFVSKPHVHHTGELMLVRSGSSIIFCEGCVTHAVAPYIVWFPPNTAHEQENYAATVYERWCFPLFVTITGYSSLVTRKHFVVELTESQCELFSTYAGLLKHFYAPPEKMWERWSTAVRSKPAKDPSSEICLSVQDETRLFHLLSLFLNELRPLIPRECDAVSEQVNEISRYITEHLAEKLTIRSLCERFYIGRSALIALFRTRMSIPIGEFITVTRVMHVKKLLAEGLPLDEIAECCGFSSASYMIKVFFRRTGMSPAVFRKTIRHSRSQ